MENLESSPSPAPSAPEAKYHEKEEVLAAFCALSPAELERLRSYARIRMIPVRHRLHDADAEDLLHEALVKTLDGKTRRWRRGVSFMHHMAACMSSIVNNWFEQAGKYQDMQGFEGSDADADPSGDPALRFDAQERINRLRSELEDDGIALSVMETMMDGRSPVEAQAFLRVDNDVYWAARKRVRRCAQRLFRSPEGGNL